MYYSLIRLFCCDVFYIFISKFKDLNKCVKLLVHLMYWLVIQYNLLHPDRLYQITLYWTAPYHTSPQASQHHTLTIPNHTVPTTPFRTTPFPTSLLQSTSFPIAPCPTTPYPSWSKLFFSWIVIEQMYPRIVFVCLRIHSSRWMYIFEVCVPSYDE